MTKKTKTGVVAEKDNYKVEIKYSPESIEKKLVKFTLTKGKEIVISADELIELISLNVNSDKLAPLFVDNTSINIVYVNRQMKAIANRDIKEGEEIRLDYSHPYPVEFAYLEEAYNIAKIDKTKEGFEVTDEFLKEVVKKSKRGEPERKNFITKFYESFKNLSLGGSS